MSTTLRKGFAQGMARGLIEFRQLLRSKKEIWSQVILNVGIALIAAAAFTNGSIGSTDVPSKHLFIAGYLSFGIVQAGLMAFPQALVSEREEGTLLRLRGIPGGIPAYLLGKVVSLGLTTFLTTVLLMVSAALVLGFPLPSTPADWAVLVSVLLLGFTAVMLAGAVLGAMLPNPRGAAALAALPVMALLFISGSFYPVTSMPHWLQIVGQLFPLKWIAQGVRSATLPDVVQTVETGGSWQLPLVFGVLAAWAILAALIAPRVLRRMTANESGSKLEARREAAAKRVTA